MTKTNTKEKFRTNRNAWKISGIKITELNEYTQWNDTTSKQGGLF